MQLVTSRKNQNAIDSGVDSDFDMLNTGKHQPNAKLFASIFNSDYVSRDLSWMQFNKRVLEQCRMKNRNLFDRLKFLAITSSNFDEFFMIRVGSLYNYLDFGKERVDYSGLRENHFRSLLLETASSFFDAQQDIFLQDLFPLFKENGFEIVTIDDLNEDEKMLTLDYFKRTIFPMLTPMLLDVYHTFPIVLNKTLTFGVITKTDDDNKNPQRLSFVQVPQNLPRFYTIKQDDMTLFLPVEDIIRWQMDKLFKNIEIVSVNLFRIIRNGDISIEESDDIEADLVDEVRRQVSNRRTGRVVRVDVESNYSPYMMKILKDRWDIDNDNIFVSKKLIDFNGLWQIINHKSFKEKLTVFPSAVPPLSYPAGLEQNNIFEVLKQRDILLHHPYNNMEPMLQLIEEAATDPYVLSIKLTIYRLAKDSRIINALLNAAENGKYVSALFEVKARFDEENNIRQAQRLQKAGCFVIYGLGNLKTHTKLCLVVRKEEDKVTRYVHMASGNYNEETAKLYTDIGLLTSKESYANDVSEFFNVITGHSKPDTYEKLITSPRDMRNDLVTLIRQEAEHAKQGLSSGIIIKLNSLEDKTCIDELYKASQAGVPIRLIIRGICCLRPRRKGLSENIMVRSLVGDYLEHTRLFYFHNAGSPKVYGGSADMMNRSFDRRVESLFIISDPKLQQEAINILDYNLKDNVNAYEMEEDGSYTSIKPDEEHAPFNIHKAFYQVTEKIVSQASLF